MTTSDINQARHSLAVASRVLILSHVKPDGDAVGSLLGLGLAVRRLGKPVTLVLEDGVPDAFRFLPESASIVRRPAGEHDLVIAVDTSDHARLGQAAATSARQVDICIDHHVTNNGFARLNFVDPAMTATAEYILALLEPLGLPLDRQMAQCLLAGLVSDTLGFRTSNVTTEALAAAQVLMRAGADLPQVMERALYRRGFAAVRFWAEGLIQLRLEDRIVWTTLPLDARQRSGYRGAGDADLINVLTTIEEADVAILFVEQSPTAVKVSWRAGQGIDLTPIAKGFGGGGHPGASGAEIAGTLEEVPPRVLAATRAALSVKSRESA